MNSPTSNAQNPIAETRPPHRGSKKKSGTTKIQWHATVSDGIPSGVLPSFKKSWRMGERSYLSKGDYFKLPENGDRIRTFFQV